MSESRERFEAWCNDEGINVERQASGVYAYAPARVAWRSWQAAGRDALERAAKACRERAQKEATLGRQFAAIDCECAIRALARKE